MPREVTGKGRKMGLICTGLHLSITYPVGLSSSPTVQNAGSSSCGFSSNKPHLRCAHSRTNLFSENKYMTMRTDEVFLQLRNSIFFGMIKVKLYFFALDKLNFQHFSKSLTSVYPWTKLTTRSINDSRVLCIKLFHVHTLKLGRIKARH